MENEKAKHALLLEDVKKNIFFRNLEVKLGRKEKKKVSLIYLLVIVLVDVNVFLSVGVIAVSVVDSIRARSFTGNPNERWISASAMEIEELHTFVLFSLFVSMRCW